MTFYIKERIENVSRLRLSGKVAAKPSEGVSLSRNGRTEKRMGKVREDGKESPLCRTIFQYLW